MKRWWLLIALLLSLGINVGILATVALHRLRPPRSEGPGGPAAVAGDPGPPGGAARIERLADRLGLAGEERERFIAIQRQFFTTTAGAREQLPRHRSDLRRELLADQPDPARIEAALEGMTESQQVLERALVELVSASREVLDPEQERLYLRFIAALRPFQNAQERPGFRQRQGAERPFREGPFRRRSDPSRQPPPR